MPAAQAQNAPRGIAIVEVPHGAYYVCFGQNMVGAFECAISRCERDGGAPCMRVRWCFPAGWSGVMRTTVTARVQRTDYLCGVRSLEALDRMFRAMCEADSYAKECALTIAWSPEGVPQEVQPGPGPSR